MSIEYSEVLMKVSTNWFLISTSIEKKIIFVIRTYIIIVISFVVANVSSFDTNIHILLKFYGAQGIAHYVNVGPGEKQNKVQL